MNCRLFAAAFAVTAILSGGTSCSTRHGTTEGSSTAKASPVMTDGPSFEILNVWKPKKVLVQGYGTPTQPADKFTLTAKPGTVFLAIELQMKTADPKIPVPNAMWNGTTLIDSKGTQQAILFSYGSPMVKYEPGGDTVEYIGDQNQFGVLAPGDKLVTIFGAPAGDNNLKLEIAKRQTLPVSAK